MLDVEDTLKLSQISLIKEFIDLKVLERKNMHFKPIDSEDEWNYFLHQILSYFWDNVEIGTIDTKEHPYASYVIDYLGVAEIVDYDIHYMTLESKLLAKHNNLLEVLRSQYNMEDYSRILTKSSYHIICDYLAAVEKDLVSDFSPITDFCDECYKILCISYSVFGTDECVHWSYYLNKYLKEDIAYLEAFILK